jgi:signal transduction histidine kinase
LDLALALAGAVTLVVDGLERGAGSPASIVPLSVVACLPLVWRSRAPLRALLAATLGVVVCLAVFHPYDTAILVAVIALYNVAALGDRRRSLVVGAATAVFLVTLIVIISDDGLPAIAPRLLVALGALAVGDTVRSRRELRAANREREERLEYEREQDSRRRIADERLRVARDLHDTVAHALVAINVRAGVAAHLGAGEDPGPVLADITTLSAEALNDLRATLSLLRAVDDPAPTAPAPGLTSMTQLLDHAQAAGLDADADVQLDGHAIPSSVEQAGFRIVQEALTNVMRHADASRATVALNVDGDTLHIDVVDDGEGASSREGPAAGHGLRGMSERAAALGGDVTAGPAEHGGWRVHARLPLKTGRQP